MSRASKLGVMLIGVLPLVSCGEESAQGAAGGSDETPASGEPSPDSSATSQQDDIAAMSSEDPAGSPNSGDTNSGDTSSGDTSSGDTNTDDSAIDPLDPTSEQRRQVEACIAYAVAYCHRSLECADALDINDPSTCAEYCPDVIFAPGSTRSIEDALECAEVYATWPCEDLDAGRQPDCVTPGTLALGQPCYFASQCESLVCNFDPDTGCGRCGLLAGLGDECSDELVACDGSLACEDGTCQREPTADKQPGDACATTSECAGLESYCKDGVCQLYPAENESCEDTIKCQAGLYCAAADLICYANPGRGEACGNDASTIHPACAEGLSCTTEFARDGGVCADPVMASLGEDCTSREVKCVNSTCECANEDCSGRTCTTDRLLGESCGSPLETCHPGLQCADGACAAIPYQGLFEAACQP